MVTADERMRRDDWTLEVVLPVSDVDRAKRFYADSSASPWTTTPMPARCGSCNSPRPARDGDVLQNVAFAFFSDPDGNGWALQHIRRV
jgi:hypothetical protein